MSNKTESKHNKLVQKIYTQHKDQLYNYILRLGNDRHLAQDIVQYTFCKVLADPEITRIKHLKAYLFTIAHNKLKDEWKRKPTVPFEGDNTMQDIPGFKPGVTPEEATEASASNTLVEKTIRQMPKNFGELMLLRYTEDLSVAEIAEITRRSVTDVKVSLHRARLKFEKLHTASMYSKVAASRNRCETVQEILLPFHDNDLTAEQLTCVNRHIKKCNTCAKDAEEMKRTRQLFVALPLIPFPLAFDEFSRQMPQLSAVTTAESQTNGEIANTASGFTEKSDVITRAVAWTTRVKIAASVAGAVVLAGTGFYFSGQGSDLTSAPRDDTENIASQQDPQTKKPVDKNTGSIILAAKLSQDSQKNLKNVKWKVESLNKSRSTKPIDIPAEKSGNNVTFTLPRGEYKATATIDGLDQSGIISVEKGESSKKTIIFNAGEIKSALLPDKDIDIDDIQWYLHKGSTPSKNPVATFTGNFNQYFPAGKYLLHAIYQGNLEKQYEIILSPGQVLSFSRPGFSYGKLSLQAALGESDGVSGFSGGAQWTVDRLKNGKVDKSNIVKIKNENPVVLLAPGAYRINLALGKHVRQSTDVIIREGKTSKSKGWSLKAGKLVLQAKVMLDSPLLPTHVSWEIDKLNANNKKINMEKFRAQNSASYYLPPGKYQVTAAYGTNLKVIKMVTIKTGETVVKDSFVFDPGVADFTAMDSRNKKTIYSALDWSLEQQTPKGGSVYTRLKQVKTGRAIFALQPGYYRITVEDGKSGKVVREFEITPGKITKDTLMFSPDSQVPRWEWK